MDMAGNVEIGCGRQRRWPVGGNLAGWMTESMLGLPRITRIGTDGLDLRTKRGGLRERGEGGGVELRGLRWLRVSRD